MRIITLAVLVLAAGCADPFAPKHFALPAGATLATGDDLALLTQAFDSVGRCFAHVAYPRPHPSTPRFYVVESYGFPDPNGSGNNLAGVYMNLENTIVVASRYGLRASAELDSAANAGNRVWFFQFVAMHEAMHAWTGYTNHPPLFFGKAGVCHEDLDWI